VFYLLYRPYQATRATGELYEPLLVYQTQVTRLVRKKIVDRKDIAGIGTKFVIGSNVRPWTTREATFTVNTIDLTERPTNIIIITEPDLCKEIGLEPHFAITHIPTNVFPF